MYRNRKNNFEEAISNTSVFFKDTKGHITNFSFTDEKGNFILNVGKEGTIILVYKSGFFKRTAKPYHR